MRNKIITIIVFAWLAFISFSLASHKHPHKHMTPEREARLDEIFLGEQKMSPERLARLDEIFSIKN